MIDKNKCCLLAEPILFLQVKIGGKFRIKVQKALHVNLNEHIYYIWVFLLDFSLAALNSEKDILISNSITGRFLTFSNKYFTNVASTLEEFSFKV